MSPSRVERGTATAGFTPCLLVLKRVREHQRDAGTPDHLEAERRVRAAATKAGARVQVAYWIVPPHELPGELFLVIVEVPNSVAIFSDLPKDERQEFGGGPTEDYEVDEEGYIILPCAEDEIEIVCRDIEDVGGLVCVYVNTLAESVQFRKAIGIEEE